MAWKMHSIIGAICKPNLSLWLPLIIPSQAKYGQSIMGTG